MDFRHNYFINKEIKDWNNIDFFVLIGVNLRMENPVLSLKLRRRVNEGAVVFNLGPNIDLDYNIVNIGNKIEDILQLVEGKHPLSSRLLKANNPLILLGSAGSQHLDMHKLVDVLRKYFPKNAVSYLAACAAKLNFFDLGFSSTVNQFSACQILYVLGADNIKLDKTSSFVIYQGHHGDRTAGLADLILPGCTPFEKIGTYVNVNGVYQMTKFIYNPPGNSRNDWKILRALAESLNVGLCFNNFKELKANLERFLVLNQHAGDFLNIACKQDMKLYNNPMSNYIEDYYLSDNILRSSYVMALSSNRFNKRINFNK